MLLLAPPRQGIHRLALRTKVAHAGFRLSWGYHQLDPDSGYDAIAAELLDEADRSNDLRELTLEHLTNSPIG